MPTGSVTPFTVYVGDTRIGFCEEFTVKFRKVSEIQSFSGTFEISVRNPRSIRQACKFFRRCSVNWQRECRDLRRKLRVIKWA